MVFSNDMAGVSKGVDCLVKQKERHKKKDGGLEGLLAVGHVDVGSKVHVSTYTKSYQFLNTWTEEM